MVVAICGGFRRPGRGHHEEKSLLSSPKLARKRLFTLYWGFFRAGKRFPMELNVKKFSQVHYIPEYALSRGSWHIWPVRVIAGHF